MDYRDKNILITQSALRNLGGSEIVTLEIASFFKEAGANVTVFTWFYDFPIKNEFEKRNIRVTTNENDKSFKNLDLAWIHHQVLPISVIKKLNQDDSKTRFFFFHMSYMEDLYLEQPYILNLEKTLADKSLFVSGESLKMNIDRNGSIFRRPSVLYNFSPDNFVDSFVSPDSPKRIGIISNHPPEEVKEATRILNDSGVVAEIIGHGSNKYELITPETLKNYDCIITIGKTIQYCLTLNLPVFLYDKFGGCGYLNRDDFEKALYANFSGRGFSQKTPKQIASEIINKYSEAKAFQDENHEMFIEKFSLSKNLHQAISNVSPRPKTNYQEEYLNYLIASETIAKNKIVAENTLVIMSHEIDRLKNREQELLSLINTMENSRIIKLDKKVRGFRTNLKKRLVKPSNTNIKINRKEYETEFIKKPCRQKIIGLIRERNESLVLKDTLDSLGQIADGIIVLDDASDDDSISIAKKHPKCIAIIKHKKHYEGDRSKEESIHRELLSELSKKYNPDWVCYQDADERIEDGKEVRDFLLKNTSNDIIQGIRLSLFDAYITKEDQEPYTKGPLYNFRNYFGQERRDILMVWKNSDNITFISKEDMREPDGVPEEKVITKFYVQHYGKALSINQWEETCDYYINHFPQYAEKWANRKGKAIHDTRSDFNTKLLTWKELKKNGGIKIN